MKRLAQVIVVVVSSGCAEQPTVTGSLEEVTVHGVVTLAGAPVNTGEVSFDPSNFSRKAETARTATIQADGSYTLKTLIGLNLVQVTSRQLVGKTTSSRGATNEESGSQSPVAVGYEQFEFTARSGDNTFNIELGKAPPQGR